MATTFKSLGENDVTTTRTLLHESIPITGSILSGTYGGAAVALGSEPHIKTYSHGMFQSVFDYPYLSSSANHIFDITAGYASTSALSGASNTQNAKKINVYNQMAQVLMGYDETGSVRLFDEDGDIVAGGTKLKECYFVNFARLLTKDEIKKGTFSLELGTKPAYDQAGAVFSSRIKITDTSGSDGYFVNSPAGEYGVLFASSSVSTQATAVNAIDTTGYVSSNADASFTISIPTTAGGLGGTAVTILLDENQNGGHSSAANRITIGTFDGSESDALAASYIIDAINGVPTATNARIVYATSGNGQAAHNLGITAAQGSSDTQITLTVDVPSTAANLTNALTTASGLDIVDVRSFTGGLDPHIAGETLGSAATNPACGLIFYQAGVAVLSGSIFSDSDDGGILTGSSGTVTLSPASAGATGFNTITSSTTDVMANNLRNRLYNLSFSNTIELNSTIYFCRVNNTEFNYSSNPTYLSTSNGPSAIVVKDGDAANDPVSYITGVGLYSPDNELLAVAKVSEPLKNDPSNESILRVRLDY